jgi:nucleolar protein 4
MSAFSDCSAVFDCLIRASLQVAWATADPFQLGSKNPFALPSVLTADPSSSLASRLVLHGRTLEVSRAVTREEAGQMKEDGERARHASDKRNTYLMREGGEWGAFLADHHSPGLLTSYP